MIDNGKGHLTFKRTGLQKADKCPTTFQFDLQENIALNTAWQVILWKN